MKILLVEDEAEMRQVIGESLLREKYIVEYADSLATALEKSQHYAYDCILLDIGLPDGSGLQVLDQLKKNHKDANIIIISAKDSLDDKLQGLDKGADDYLPKPFHIAELHARIRSVMRRKNFEGNHQLQWNNLTIDFDQRIASVDNQLLALNRKEFDMLSFFMQNKNRLISKSSLAEHVWGDFIDQADDFEFVYSQIKNLRKKLKDAHATIEIQAVYGIGYKLISQ